MELSCALHALVTGGASGIGLGIVNALANLGIAVTVSDIDTEALDAGIARRPGQFLPIELDTRDRQGWVDAKAF